MRWVGGCDLCFSSQNSEGGGGGDSEGRVGAESGAGDVWGGEGVFKQAAVAGEGSRGSPIDLLSECTCVFHVQYHATFP